MGQGLNEGKGLEGDSEDGGEKRGWGEGGLSIKVTVGPRMGSRMGNAAGYMTLDDRRLACLSSGGARIVGEYTRVQRRRHKRRRGRLACCDGRNWLEGLDTLGHQVER